MSGSVDNKSSNLNALRADVDEITNVLKVIVEKLVDRGDRLDALQAGLVPFRRKVSSPSPSRLDALQAKADDLNQSSVHFYGSTKRVHRKMKWRNYKITIFIVVVVIIIIGVVVLAIVQPWKKK